MFSEYLLSDGFEKGDSGGGGSGQLSPGCLFGFVILGILLIVAYFQGSDSCPSYSPAPRYESPQERLNRSQQEIEEEHRRIVGLREQDGAINGVYKTGYSAPFTDYERQRYEYLRQKKDATQAERDEYRLLSLRARVLGERDGYRRAAAERQLKKFLGD